MNLPCIALSAIPACRTAVRFIVIACLLAALAHPARGADERHNFNLEEGAADRMLKTFSEQSGQQVIYPTELVKGIRTREVKGQLTSREALDLMLADTGLVATEDAQTGAFAVKQAPSGPNASRAAPSEGSVRPGSARGEGGVVTLEKYEVTESRVDGLINKGLLQAGPDAPLYHSVITRENIERLGATSMEELFRYLPQTTTGVTSSQGVVGNFGSGARFPTTSLRGLPASQTVILINGRALPRTTPTTTGGADINRIPIAAIERIEILPYAGSAIYGAGAIGGAINIILRKDYSGRDLTTYVGTSTNGGATEYRFTYVEGRSFNSGRTNLTLTLNYQHRQPLYARDRDYLATLLSRYGPASTARLANGTLAFEQYTLPAYAGVPGTIVVGNPPSSAVNDLGIPGAPGIRFATIPAGTSPSQSTSLTPASFSATAGKLNTSSARYGRMVLYEPIDSTSINAQVEHKFIPEKLEGYGEFTLGYNRRDTDYPELLSVSLSATDPLNPFRTNVTPGFVGRPVVVYLDTPEIPDANTLQEYQSARAVIGLKGSLSRNWDWSVDGVIDYANSTSNATTPQTYNLQLQALSRPAAAASADVRRAIYPLLADHGMFPISAADAQKYYWFHFHAGNRSVVTEGNVRVTGDVFRLPAGPLRTSATGKYRSFDLKGSRILDGSVDAALLVSGVPQDTGNLPIDSKRDTLQGAIELAVPVIGKDWRPLPVDGLDLNLSASHESNDSAGHNQSSQLDFDAASKGSSTYVAAAKLQITRDIAFRGSFSEGFYAPDWNDVSDLVTPQVLASGLVADPKRGNTIQSTSWTLYNGGNPALKPESARSVNVGMIFTPRFVPGLSLTVDYWRTKKEDAIIRTNFVQVISSSDDFASSIVRAPATPSDQALGWLGVITEVHSGPINVSNLQTEGLDVRGLYSHSAGSLGKLTVDGNASFTNHFQTRALPTSSLVETAGAGGPLRWRGYVSATLERNSWGFTVTGRYVGHYASSTTAPTAAFPTATGLDGGRIPAYLHWDVQITREFSYGANDRGWRNWIAGTRWTLGCLNVLDEEPSFVSDIQSAFYNRQVDPRQRFVYVQVRKSM